MGECICNIIFVNTKIVLSSKLNQLFNQLSTGPMRTQGIQGLQGEIEL